MPTMRKTDNSKQVIAIACADIHLSSMPPAARAGEPDWFKAMRRPLDELKRLQSKCENVPILCAGDVFHHWKSSPELINFAIDNLPEMYSIPGQHDMPYHSTEEMEKSAYETLVKTQTLLSVTEIGRGIAEAIVFGFEWGAKVTPPLPIVKDYHLHICLHHAYRWIDGSGFTGAEDQTKIEDRPKEYKGYEVIVIGDNHKSWDVEFDHQMKVFNVGSFMRRNADQTAHRPRVGIVFDDGKVGTYYFDTSKDVFDGTTNLTPDDEEKLAQLRAGSLDIGAFAELQRQIDKLDDPAVEQMGFYEALRLVLGHKGLNVGVKKIITEAIEHGRQTKQD